MTIQVDLQYDTIHSLIVSVEVLHSSSELSTCSTSCCAMSVPTWLPMINRAMYMYMLYVIMSPQSWDMHYFFR